MDGPTRIVIADDHYAFRLALTHLLTVQPDFEIVGEAVSGMQAVRLVEQLRPDVVLMDVSMPQVDGVEATRQIAIEYPATRIIGLSMHAAADLREAMLAAGAAAYVTKDAPAERVLEAIRGLPTSVGPTTA